MLKNIIFTAFRRGVDYFTFGKLGIYEYNNNVFT